MGFGKPMELRQSTLLVKDLGDNESPSSLTRINSTLFFFRRNDNAGDQELWKSDGSGAGTVIVRNINQSGSSSPRNLINVNGVLYFTAIDENTIRDLSLPCFKQPGRVVEE
jgi:ELWxxDGT repeat protein